MAAPATETEVANLALAALGSKRITSISDTADPLAVQCDAHFAQVRREVLSAHRWPCAMKRAALALDGAFSPSAVTQANPPVVSATAHGLSNGTWVGFADVAGMTQINGLRGTVKDKTTDTFKVDGIDASGFAAFVSGTVFLAAPFGWTYAWALPSDFIRLCEINGQNADDKADRFDIEAGRILCDESAVSIRYVFDADDPADWSPRLLNCVAVLLSSRVARAVTGDEQLEARILQQYEAITLPRAQALESVQSRSNENHPLRQTLARSETIRARFRPTYGSGE